MIDFRTNWLSRVTLPVLLLCAAMAPLSAQRVVSVDGQVRDKTKIPLPGATVTFQLAGSSARSTKANKAGAYAFPHLTPGQYTVRVEARGFQTYEARDFHLSGTQNRHLNFVLDLAPVKQEVVVASGEKPLTIEPESSPSTILLSGAGTSGLPDDPNDFSAAVQALAGPSVVGAFGLQVFVNGLINSQMPPKETISQIRINDNPFSAENDRPAPDRITVVTKGGGRELHGETYMNLDVGRWNARNPFAAPLPPAASNLFGANIGGPLSPRASFFVSVEQAQIRFKNAIQATVLNSLLVPKTVRYYEHDFERSLLVAPRLDIILNQKNTLMVNYSSSGYVLPHEGVGGTSLPESGYRIASNEQTMQLSETAILTPKLIDESKFQFLRTNLAQTPTTLATGISVDKAFITGNPSTALLSSYQRPWEFQNSLTATLGAHGIRTGIRVRGDHSHQVRKENEFGTYVFSSGTGPELGVDNTPTKNAQGQVVPVTLTALERYRRALLFEGAGMAPAAIRALGGGASSFSMYSGNPLTKVQQYDFGAYIQEEWHIRPNLLLGAGIRYEAQTHLQDRWDVGPRFSVAWAPAKSAKGNVHTVLRGGIGLFYQRLDDSLVLQANHSANPQFRYAATDPSVLDQFPGTPSIASLTPYAVRTDTLRLDPHLRAPATLQTSFGLEQELPFKTRLSATVTEARTTRDLLIRDVSAFKTGNPRFLNLQSTGDLTQRQLKVDLSNQLNKRVKLTADYVLNKANSNTDGTKNPAADPESLVGEFGRSDLDIRNNFTLTGSLDAIWGLRFSPFVVASSNRPFNIISGNYKDPDIPLTQRPVLATNPNIPGVIFTPYGNFILDPSPGETSITRNFGVGAAFFSASVRVSKTFAFGKLSGGTQADHKGTADEKTRYTMVVSAQVIDLSNHTNPGPFQGNLSSPSFGTASSLAPGFNFGGGTALVIKEPQTSRRIEAQIRFTF